MKGRDDTTTFLPLNSRIGAQNKESLTVGQYLRLCYRGILKERFLAYSSPVMLISKKLTKDKRVITDFRHLNVRIAKNNLAYPLVRDTFLVLGNSKCKVLSVLDLKDAFHSFRLSENSNRHCRILPNYGSSSYLYQRMPMGLKIHQQYGNHT